METTVQARFDSKAQAALKSLTRDNGWTTSQALRECVLRVYKQSTAQSRPQLVGIGCVDIGPGDLATNKKYLKDLGRKSMGKGWRRPGNRLK